MIWCSSGAADEEPPPHRRESVGSTDPFCERRVAPSPASTLPQIRRGFRSRCDPISGPDGGVVSDGCGLNLAAPARGQIGHSAKPFALVVAPRTGHQHQQHADDDDDGHGYRHDDRCHVRLLSSGGDLPLSHRRMAPTPTPPPTQDGPCGVQLVCLGHGLTSAAGWPPPQRRRRVARGRPDRLDVRDRIVGQCVRRRRPDWWPGAAQPGIALDAPPGVPALPGITATSFVVADADTGDILAAKNAHAKLAPASTMKTLTALTVIPLLPANLPVVAGRDAPDADGTKAGIVAGTTYTVNDFFTAMLMMSANDAAVAPGRRQRRPAGHAGPDERRCRLSAGRRHRGSDARRPRREGPVVVRL